MQPSNVLMGDQSPVDLPQKPVDETALNELKNKAQYSKSKEYKELKDKADARIKFYQAFLPNGQPVATATKEQRLELWGFANLIIAEFDQLFSEHESAEETLREEFGE